MSRRAACAPPLPGVLLLLISVWLTLVLCQESLAPRLGRPAAVLLSFSLASVRVLASRGQPLPRPTAEHAAALGLGALAGALSYPLWIGLIAALGTAIGLEAPGTSPGRSGVLLGAATVVVAPVFEEILYRGLLLQALRPRFGATGAVVLSSVAFAIPHLESWAILGTFVVGLGLGTVMCRLGRVAPCIGLHSGLNLAAWLSR
jgi:membrane protease YdiL (CAAX protease family)